MTILDTPTEDELPSLSLLCLRSKAYWGYDDEFMRLCRDELTLTEADLADDQVIVAYDGKKAVGVAQISCEPDDCYLEKLFVEPSHIGQGLGRLLFDWAVAIAGKLGAEQMTIEADPDAVPFYRSMGCQQIGTVSSGSVPGRTIPKLVIEIHS